MKKNRIWAQATESLAAICLATELGSAEEKGAIATVATLHNMSVAEVESAVQSRRVLLTKSAPVVAPAAAAPTEPQGPSDAEKMAAEIDARLAVEA